MLNVAGFMNPMPAGEALPLPLTIRPAQAADLETITSIYNEAILTTTATFDIEPKTRAQQLVWFQAHQGRHPVLVADLDNQVVGWASLSPWSDRQAYAETAEVSCYVAAHWRRRGVGRRLLQELVRQAGDLGFHTLVGRVAEESHASRHLCAGLGFAAVGTLKEVGLKFGRRLDVHILQKMLK